MKKVLFLGMILLLSVACTTIPTVPQDEYGIVRSSIPLQPIEPAEDAERASSIRMDENGNIVIDNDQRERAISSWIDENGHLTINQ